METEPFRRSHGQQRNLISPHTNSGARGGASNTAAPPPHPCSHWALMGGAVLCVQAFFESHPAPSAERTVQQCCENILLNAAWLKRDSEDIHQFFLQRKGPPPATA